MDFSREWTAFALEAEHNAFGMRRIAKAHNHRIAELRAQLAEAQKDAK